MLQTIRHKPALHIAMLLILSLFVQLLSPPVTVVIAGILPVCLSQQVRLNFAGLKEAL